MSRNPLDGCLYVFSNVVIVSPRRAGVALSCQRHIYRWQMHGQHAQSLQLLISIWPCRWRIADEQRLVTRFDVSSAMFFGAHFRRCWRIRRYLYCILQVTPSSAPPHSVSVTPSTLRTHWITVKKKQCIIHRPGLHYIYLFVYLLKNWPQWFLFLRHPLLTRFDMIWYDMNLFSKITKIHDKQAMNMHVILLRMTH